MARCEVEIKSLLSSKTRAEALRSALEARDPKTRLLSKHSQLNHYFEGGDTALLLQAVTPLLAQDDAVKLQDIVARGKTFSVRTRQADGAVLFVLKASLDTGSSHNTVTRLEFEAPLRLTLDALDKLLLQAGFFYQAKWSREREEYTSAGVTVCLDKNAGYGYLAEFEKVVDDESQLESARNELRAFMEGVGATELSQERLERMFAFYNANWQDYYGTDKVFVVE
jgi:adenylate cyclase class IV